MRRMHALGQLLLRETGTGASLDHRRRQRKLALKGIVGFLVFGILVPGGKDAPTEIIFPLISSPLHVAARA